MYSTGVIDWTCHLVLFVLQGLLEQQRQAQDDLLLKHTHIVRRLYQDEDWWRQWVV